MTKLNSENLKAFFLGNQSIPSIPLLFIFSLLHILVNGYEFAAQDLSLYIPFVPRYFDASILNPNDHFLIMFSRTYTLMWIFIYPIIKVFGWELTLFSLQIVGRFFALLAIWILANRICKNHWAAWLVILLMLANRAVGGSATSLFETYPTTRAIALPFVLFGLYYIIEKRLLVAAILMGIAWNIHIFTCLMFSVIGFAMILYNWKAYLKLAEVKEDEDQTAVLMKQFFFPIFWFLLFAAPLLVWKFSTPEIPVSDFNDEDWLELNRIRGGYSFLSLWGIGEWIKIGNLLMLTFIGLNYFREKQTIPWIIPGLIAMGVMSFIQYIGSEIHISQSIYQIQFTRCLWFLDFLAMCGCAGLIVQRTSEKHGWASAIIGSTLLYSMLFWQSQWLPLVFAIYLMLLLVQESIAIRIWSVLFFLAFLIIQILHQPNWGEGEIWPQYSIIFILSAAPLVYCWLCCNHRFTFPILCLLTVLSFYTAALPHKTLKNPFEIHFKYLDWPGQLENNPWYRLQTWARDNTEPHAVFFTPPWMMGFRSFSLRSSFGEWKDGAPTLFNRAYAKAWRDKMSLMNFWPGKHSSLATTEYHSRTADEWLQLATAHEVQYLVTIAEVDYPFEKVYQEAEYAIWKLY